MKTKGNFLKEVAKNETSLSADFKNSFLLTDFHITTKPFDLKLTFIKHG
jgi:hypothetical protein